MKLLAQGTVNLGPLTAPAPAFAPTNNADVSAFSAPLTSFISNFLGFITGLAGIMFLIYFIIAGLSWVTAGGDKGKVESARTSMTNAALGLIIVIAAYSIAGIVGGVLGIDILDPVGILSKLKPAAP